MNIYFSYKMHWKKNTFKKKKQFFLQYSGLDTRNKFYLKDHYFLIIHMYVLVNIFISL